MIANKCAINQYGSIRVLYPLLTVAPTAGLVTSSLPGWKRERGELYPHPGVRGGGGDVVFTPLVWTVDAGVAGRRQLTWP